MYLGYMCAGDRLPSGGPAATIRSGNVTCLIAGLGAVRSCLWRLARSPFTALTSADLRSEVFSGVLRLPCLGLSRRVSCTNPCTNQVPDLRASATGSFALVVKPTSKEPPWQRPQRIVAEVLPLSLALPM